MMPWPWNKLDVHEAGCQRLRERGLAVSHRDHPWYPKPPKPEPRWRRIENVRNTPSCRCGACPGCERRRIAQRMEGVVLEFDELILGRHPEPPI